MGAEPQELVGAQHARFPEERNAMGTYQVSRPWGQNSFDHIPAAVIGASIGQIGTAMAQQSLRSVLSFCNARQMTAPEAYIHYSPGLIDDDGRVTTPGTEEFLRQFMAAFAEYTARVLTVIPQA